MFASAKRNIKKLITINDESGELIVLGHIDREVFDWLNMTVGATDNGLPPMTTYTQVSIKVCELKF